MQAETNSSNFAHSSVVCQCLWFSNDIATGKIQVFLSREHDKSHWGETSPGPGSFGQTSSVVSISLTKCWCCYYCQMLHLHSSHDDVVAHTMSLLRPHQMMHILHTRPPLNIMHNAKCTMFCIACCLRMIGVLYFKNPLPCMDQMELLMRCAWKFY